MPAQGVGFDREVASATVTSARTSTEVFLIPPKLGKNRGKELIISSEPRINERIRVPEVRLIGSAGEQLGVVSTDSALRAAEEAGLDLVEVAPNARPPVAKLMDYGKYKYEAAMKERDARRKQANSQIKEIRFRLKIDDHDFETKKNHVERFLKAGDKVKVMIMFRGREQSRPEMGVKLLQRLADDVEELATVEMMPRQDGRNMVMVLAPTRKKQPTKSEQRRQREGERPKKVNRQQLKDERKRRKAEAEKQAKEGKTKAKSAEKPKAKAADKAKASTTAKKAEAKADEDE